MYFAPWMGHICPHILRYIVNKLVSFFINHEFNKLLKIKKYISREMASGERFEFLKVLRDKQHTESNILL